MTGGSAPGAPCVSVVMPVFNEAQTVANIVEAVLAQPSVLELVIVDDCSRDATWAELQRLAAAEPRVKVFRHEVNQGKGAGHAWRSTSSPSGMIKPVVSATGMN